MKGIGKLHLIQTQLQTIITAVEEVGNSGPLVQQFSSITEHKK